MRRLTLIAAVLSIWLAAPVAASPMIDCPMRDLPFSTASPLIDILLNPKATTVADKALRDMATRLPRQFMNTTPPSFAAILTLKEASGFLRISAFDLAAIDRQLAAIPVTTADKVARCARYDTRPPDLLFSTGKPRVLLFEKINGFRDGPSVDAAHAAFVAMAARKGWALVTTDKGSAFTPAILSRFDVVIWNNISGDVLTLSQRRAFQRYMEQGGGFIGVHGSAGDPVYFWEWYVDTLLGARFSGHPMAPHFQTARIKLDNTTHPVAQGLPTTWEMNDEWYSFKNNPRTSGSVIIATLDENTYKLDGVGGQNLRMGDHPIAWTRCIGRGRMFYSAIGHRPELYSDAIYIQMLEQAVDWTAGLGASDCKQTKRP
jgi:type 1 glutamine amidotransferase